MSMPVIEILKQYGAATFELAILATIVALVVGIPLGKTGGSPRGSLVGRGDSPVFHRLLRHTGLL